MHVGKKQLINFQHSQVKGNALRKMIKKCTIFFLMKHTEKYNRNNPWLWVRNSGADFEALPVRHITSLLKQNVGHNRLISNSGFNWV